MSNATRTKGQTHAMPDTSQLHAFIAIDTQEDGTLFSATLENKTRTELTLRYQLDIEKKGQSGQSVSSQSGSAQLAAQSTDVLSRVKLNIQENDRCDLRLRIYQGNQLLIEKKSQYVP